MPSPPRPRPVMSVRLSSTELAQLDELAVREERTRSQVIRRLLRRAYEAAFGKPAVVAGARTKKTA